MKLEIGNLVECNISDLYDIQIIDKNKEEYLKNESEYSFILSDQPVAPLSKGKIALKYIDHGLFKDVFSDTYIYSIDNLDLDVLTKDEFIEKYQKYIDSPLSISNYIPIKEQDIDEEYLNTSINDLSNVFEYVSNKLQEKHLEIIGNNSTYRGKVKQKLFDERMR